MTTPALVRKSLIAEYKVLDDAQGIVEAYVNTMGVVDHDGEVLAPGAFLESIGRRLPPVAWMHDQSVIVGGVTFAEERLGRLFVRIQYDLDTEQGAYAFKMVSRGRVPEWSVGFYCRAEHMESIDERPTRVIDAVDWVEVSNVLRGASPGTYTSTVKSLPDTELPAPTADLAPATTEPAVPSPETSTEGAVAAGTTDRARAALSLERARLGLAGVLFSPGSALAAVKQGRRNSAADTRRIQDAHDLLVSLGAMCAEPD